MVTSKSSLRMRDFPCSSKAMLRYNKLLFFKHGDFVHLAGVNLDGRTDCRHGREGIDDEKR